MSTQIALPLALGLINWALALNYKNDITKPFKAKINAVNNYGYNDSKENVNVFTMSNLSVPIYPRITVFQDDYSQMIFDSSDFEVITKSFIKKSYPRNSNFPPKYFQPRFSPGQVFYINKEKYKVKKVYVDILSIFDDYSYLGHTNKYTGIDMPYNVQIFVSCEPMPAEPEIFYAI